MTTPKTSGNEGQHSGGGFTPGPLEARPEAATLPDGPYMVVDLSAPAGVTVCTACYCTKADAQLYAAAPELLEACREMVRLADMGLEESLLEPEADGNFAAYNRARAAIAKAVGE